MVLWLSSTECWEKDFMREIFAEDNKLEAESTLRKYLHTPPLQLPVATLSLLHSYPDTSEFHKPFNDFTVYCVTFVKM
jgi:hypothetical protein